MDGPIERRRRKGLLAGRLGCVVNEVNYRSEFPWPIAANGTGASMELINPALDNDLGSSWAAPIRTSQPSPGKTNQVYTANPAPNIRQVMHQPKTPSSTNDVVVSAKVTDADGVASVKLLCRLSSLVITFLHIYR